jgi:hypothetical protein
MNFRYKLQLLLLTTGIAAQPLFGQTHTQGENAIRLVVAMKADQSDLTKLQKAVEWSVRDGKSTQKDLECVKSLPQDSFTAIYAKTFQDSLTADEINDAASFFETPLGQKFIARRIALAYKVPGESNSTSAPGYSETDLKELRVIAKKTWGEKLLRYTVVDTPAHKQAVEAKIDELLKFCSTR